MKRDKAPSPIMVKAARGVSPVSAYDSEILITDPIGTEYDLVKRTKRSNPQLRRYWSGLNRAAKATGRWPDGEHLHEELKLALGYYRKVANLKTGEVHLIPDSIALDKMPHDQFQEFQHAAEELLIRTIGFDPWSLMEAA